MSVARLIIRGRGNWLHTHYIERNGTTRIGRAADNDIVLNDFHSSGHHAEVMTDDAKFFVRDLESRNGTFVNGRKVEESELNNGDTLRIGTTDIALSTEPEDDFSVLSISERAEGMINEPIPERVEEFAAPPEKRGADELKQDLLDAQGLIRQLGAVKEYYRHAVFRLDKPLHLISFSLRYISKQVGAENGFIMQINPETRAWTVRARYGQILDWSNTGEAQEDAGVVLPMSLTVVDEVLRKGEPIVSASTMADPRFDASKSIEFLGIHSCVCAPLKHGGETMGVIYCDRRSNMDQFKKSDSRVFIALAEELSFLLYP